MTDDSFNSPGFALDEDLHEDLGLLIFDSSSPLDPDSDDNMLFSSASDNGASDSSMILDPHELHDCIDSSIVPAPFPTAPYVDEALSQRMCDHVSSFGGPDLSDDSQYQALFDLDEDHISALVADSVREDFAAPDEEHEFHWDLGHASLVRDPSTNMYSHEDGWLDW
jgi:hypothetical protein